MRFGLFSNGQRLNQVAKIAYDEDLYEIIVADELGIEEAWISEHGVFVGFQAPDQLPSADLFICKAAALTKQIRLGPGIRPLPYFHPLQVATDAAVCSHLTDGRYMAGFGLGLGSVSQLRGTLPAQPRVMVREAVDIIQKAWTASEPFDWEGEVWQGKQWYIIPKPLGEIESGLACSKTDTTIELAAAKGLYPLMSWTSTNAHMADMIKTYLSASIRDPRHPPSRDRIRIAKFVYVCDSIEEAKRDLSDAPLGGALPRLDAFIPPGKSRETLSVADLIDQGLFCCGDPDTVYQGLKRFHDDLGGFGVLLLVVGKDWTTREKRERSMRRFMAEVAPRLAPIRPDMTTAA